MKKQKLFLLSSLLLGASSMAFGDALDLDNTIINVTLNDKGRLPQGIVWQSSRLFTGVGQFSSTDATGVTLVLTQRENIGGGGKVHPNLLKQNYQALPIELTSGELYMTFLGTIRATWGEAALPTWSANDYASAVTKPHSFVGEDHQAITFGDIEMNGQVTGTVTYELWPVIYCAKSSGCQVPSKDLTFNALYLVMYTGNQTEGRIDTTQLVSNGELKFEVGCSFSIYPTAFTSVEITTQNKDAILWSSSSSYSASCTRSGSLYVMFTPSNGMLESDARIGLTNLDGIGLVHRTQSTLAPTSLQQCDVWHESKNLGALLSNGSGKQTTEGTVHWGFYQYKDVPATGSLDTSVNYEFWVE